MLTTTLRTIHIPSDEEDAAITAAALSDPDNPPLTDEELARLRPAREVLPPALYAALTDKSKPSVFRHVTDAQDAARREAIRRRGPAKTAPKEHINIRLSPDLLAHLRGSGRGWQTRIDTFLREAMQQGKI